MKPLRIPLASKPTRQRSWRVVSLATFLLIACLFSGLVYRLWLTRDTTSVLAPPESDYTLRILLTPHTKELLHTHLGKDPLLAGGPWTIDEALSWSNREIALHFTQASITAVSIDAPLPETVAQQAETYGFSTQKQAQTTQLSKTSHTQVVNSSFQIRLKQAFNPFFHGEILTHRSQTTTSTPIRIGKRGITIREKHRLQAEVPYISPAEDAQILAVFSHEPSSNNTLMESLIPIESRFKTAAFTQPSTMIMAQDDKGIAYWLTIFTSEFTIEELARIGKEMMKRTSLSTTALTLEDGSVVQELRSNPNKITSNITTEEQASFILLSDNAGNRLRVTKTPEQVTISNRSISTNISEFSLQSTCSQGVQQQIALSQLLSNQRAAAQTYPQPQNHIFGFYGSFQELISTKRFTRLCW